MEHRDSCMCGIMVTVVSLIKGFVLYIIQNEEQK